MRFLILSLLFAQCCCGEIMMLGVDMVPVPFSEAKQRHLDPSTGIFVLDVYTGSSADLSGIKKGDVILKVDGIEVSRMMSLRIIMATKFQGDPMTVLLDREGRTIELECIAKNIDWDGPDEPFEDIDQQCEENYRRWATLSYRKWLAWWTKQNSTTKR